jgi:soluble lytic murein transglycosylase-like protein
MLSVRRAHAFLMLAVALGCVKTVQAAHIERETSRSYCFELAAAHYQVSAALLRAMAHVESGLNPTVRHDNADGTYDLGVMQINSSHFPELAERFHITERMLTERPCINIVVGAYLLRGMIDQFGPTWRAVGAYAAGGSARKERARQSYATLVARTFSKSWHARRVASAAPARRMLVLE